MDDFIAYLASFSGHWSYVVILAWLLACGVGIPIPEDISLFSAGLLSYYGTADVHMMIAVAMFGVLAGDSFIFVMGRRYGPALLEHRTVQRVVSPQSLQTAEGLLHKWGNVIFFAARFAPGFRAPVFFSAGALAVRFRVFLFFDGLAACISVPTIVYATYYFGDNIADVIQSIRRTNMGIVSAIAVVVVVLLVKRYLSKGRG